MLQFTLIELPRIAMYPMYRTAQLSTEATACVAAGLRYAFGDRTTIAHID
jgi:hypothetical protein